MLHNTDNLSRIWRGRDHAPPIDFDEQCLQEPPTCFLTKRGLSTDRGALKAATYFLLQNMKEQESGTLEEARKAITS